MFLWIKWKPSNIGRFGLQLQSPLQHRTTTRFQDQPSDHMIVEIFIIITTRAECRAGRHKPRTLPGGVWEGSLSYFWFNTMPAAQHQAVWRRGRDTTLSIEEGGRWKQKGGMGGFLIKCQHDLNSQLWREHMEARAPDCQIEEILFSGSCDSSHANRSFSTILPTRDGHAVADPCGSCG